MNIVALQTEQKLDQRFSHKQVSLIKERSLVIAIFENSSRICMVGFEMTQNIDKIVILIK